MAEWKALHNDPTARRKHLRCWPCDREAADPAQVEGMAGNRLRRLSRAKPDLLGDVAAVGRAYYAGAACSRGPDRRRRHGLGHHAHGDTPTRILAGSVDTKQSLQEQTSVFATIESRRIHDSRGRRTCAEEPAVQIDSPARPLPKTSAGHADLPLDD